jgi:hypothetical protein
MGIIVHKAKSVAAASIAAVAMAIASMPSVSAAEVGNGNWTPSFCNLATARFIQLTGAEKAFGIGPVFPGQQSAPALEIVRGGTGEAGGQILFNYTSSGVVGSDFRTIRLVFKDGGVNRQNVRVHFCFLSNHGNGSLVTYDTTLSRMNATNIGTTGWTNASLNSREFGGLDVRNFVLKAVTFSISVTGNCTIGDTNLDVGSGTVRPVGLSLSPNTDCGILDTCPGQVI